MKKSTIIIIIGVILIFGVLFVYTFLEILMCNTSSVVGSEEELRNFGKQLEDRHGNYSQSIYSLKIYPEKENSVQIIGLKQNEEQPYIYNLNILEAWGANYCSKESKEYLSFVKSLEIKDLNVTGMRAVYMNLKVFGENPECRNIRYKIKTEIKNSSGEKFYEKIDYLDIELMKSNGRDKFCRS